MRTSKLSYLCQMGPIKWIEDEIARTSDLDAYDDTGMTVFMMSVLTGRKDSAAALANAGADIKKPAKSGENALVLAVWHSDPDMLRFLLHLEGAAWIPADITPALASLINHTDGRSAEIAEILLDAGADPNVADPLFGTTLLMSACLRKDVALAELMATVSDLDRRDMIENTALHHACTSRPRPGSPENERERETAAAIFRVLVDRGARIDVMNADFKSPIRMAKESGWHDLAAWMDGKSVEEPRHG
jgi:ankyrin repeat protein